MELSERGELPTGSWNPHKDVPKVRENVGLPGFETDCSGNISNSLPLACDRKGSVCAPGHSTESNKCIQGIQSCRENKRLNGAICSYLSERDASEITQSQRMAGWVEWAWE